jgi:hypothetical protein
LTVFTGQAEIRELTNKGILPVLHDFETRSKEMEALDDEAHPFLMGKVSAVVHEEKPAKAIVDEIVAGAVKRLNAGNAMLIPKSKI